MPGKRNTLSFSTQLSAVPEKVFPLLCPVKEYDWIPTWQCKMLYSKSGYAELGCVFSTDLDSLSGTEVWVVCTYEKDRKIGFVRTGKHTTIRYDVTLTPHGSGSTIEWTQEITGLDRAGDMVIDTLTPPVYDEKMTHLNNLLEHYLLTGKSINDE